MERQAQWETIPEIIFSPMAWPLLEGIYNVVPTEIWQQLVFPQETKLWTIHPSSSSCWLTSPFCLSHWDLSQSKKQGVFHYGGLPGNHVERWTENMAISGIKFVLLGAVYWHLNRSSARLCYSPTVRENGLLMEEAYGVHDCDFITKTGYIF